MKKNKLPILGVGPIYVIISLFLTILGLILDHYKILYQWKIPVLKPVMLLVGLLLIIVGIVLWFHAVIIQKITYSIKKGELITTGVYAIVRNPIYSAFIAIFTGILLITNNLFLLILPLIFWFSLTILLKKTEEKWLIQTFGDEYMSYCKHVNRIIPWFKKD